MEDYDSVGVGCRRQIQKGCFAPLISLDAVVMFSDRCLRGSRCSDMFHRTVVLYLPLRISALNCSSGRLNQNPAGDNNVGATKTNLNRAVSPPAKDWGFADDFIDRVLDMFVAVIRTGED